MKTPRKTFWITAMLFSFILFACVTINIYFPAEKVESVAEEIVDEIRGQKTDGDQSLLKKNRLSISSTLAGFLCSPAWAADTLTVSNPTIRALKESMKARYARMRPYYDKGVLKEKKDGYVAIGNASGLGLKEKRDLNSLVSAENSDRERLYQEIAKAMDIDPSQVHRIGEIFAKEWQKPVR
ncbi:MAG: DUF1318 domain-containing protein [Deltaproteobacteria bacterium]|nr:DUF1318 domain-containing protein [Deltaproteobacteria bacterium]